MPLKPRHSATPARSIPPKAMADNTPASSAPSSSGSYSDIDMWDMAEWQAEVAKTFKVKELEELLSAKNKTVQGMKAHKAMEVAWCYTKEEIAAWRRQRRTAGAPALMVNRGGRQASMQEFFPSR